MIMDTGDFRLFLPTPSRIQALQRVGAFARHDPTFASLLVEFSCLTNPVHTVFPDTHVADVLLDRSRSTTWQQVVWHMLHVRLLTHSMALGVVSQMAQVLGVFFEMALQLGRVDKFLAQFLGSGFADGDTSHGSDGICDTVTEALEF